MLVDLRRDDRLDGAERQDGDLHGAGFGERGRVPCRSRQATTPPTVQTATVTFTVQHTDITLNEYCISCHKDFGDGITDAYLTSRHYTNTNFTVYCFDCHNPTGLTVHPYIDKTEALASCAACHDGDPARVPSHGLSDPNCVGCHNPHSAAATAGACNSCHGMPPATGAHIVHFGLEGGSSYTDLKTLEERDPTATIESAPRVYAYGCAICHSVDTANHKNGTVDVILYEAAADPASLKARNAVTAAYNQDGTCSGVYCHSTGQATPTFQTTPTWTSADEPTCGDCHGDPPAYPSGGEAAATANSHIALADDGWTWGHFSGIRGPWHTAQHGNPYGRNEDSAPITCQTCHYETTDPAGAGPSGFYWQNTSGNYLLPGDLGLGDGLVCSQCHTPDDPSGPVGNVLPLRHVNGKRDVMFDPREDLPQDIAWLPADPTKKPARPMWFTNASKTSGLADHGCEHHLELRDHESDAVLEPVERHLRPGHQDLFEYQLPCAI